MSVSNPSVVCQPRSYCFLPFSSELSWPASALVSWQHIVKRQKCGRVSKLGCMQLNHHAKSQRLHQQKFMGQLDKECPYQFISIKAMKHKIESQLSEDMLWVYVTWSYIQVSSTSDTWLRRSKAVEQQEQVWGRVPDFQWGNWQMFLVCQCNDIPFLKDMS